MQSTWHFASSILRLSADQLQTLWSSFVSGSIWSTWRSSEEPQVRHGPFAANHSARRAATLLRWHSLFFSTSLYGIALVEVPRIELGSVSRSVHHLRTCPDARHRQRCLDSASPIDTVCLDHRPASPRAPVQSCLLTDPSPLEQRCWGPALRPPCGRARMRLRCRSQSGLPELSGTSSRCTPMNIPSNVETCHPRDGQTLTLRRPTHNPYPNLFFILARVRA